MLKSYEAIYKNGIVRWLNQNPIQANQELHVIVEVNETDTYNNMLGQDREHFDSEIEEQLQKWRNGNRHKPQGGRLRPLIQGQTVAKRVLEDRGK